MIRKKSKLNMVRTSTGVKVGERVDYALFCQGVPVMFIEAKGCKEKWTTIALNYLGILILLLR